MVSIKIMTGSQLWLARFKCFKIHCLWNDELEIKNHEEAKVLLLQQL